MNKPTDELIEKFLSGKCTPEENEAVYQYLQDNPEEQYLLNEWKNTSSNEDLPDGYSEGMLSFITSQTKEKQPVIRKLNLRWAAVAAGIILTVGVWWMLQISSGNKGQAVVKNKAVSDIETWVQKENPTDTEMRLLLPDSSVVLLSASARLRYRTSFGKNERRDVYLQGKAFFEVTKNKAKPFTVYSSGIATTAVGTGFDVEETALQVRVRLYTGKVLIANDSLQLNAFKQYLDLGEELVYNKASSTFAVNTFKRKNKTANPGFSDTAPAKNNSWYMFDNQPLAQVLKQLQELYNVEINYKESDIKNSYFIGKLEKTESIDNIIRNIALLNKLTVTRKDNRYWLKKIKP